jgi:hypothetical protein
MVRQAPPALWITPVVRERRQRNPTTVAPYTEIMVARSYGAGTSVIDDHPDVFLFIAFYTSVSLPWIFSIFYLL